ncbi:energy transducer TonB [Pseudoalteromonas aliena]|uniref:energy transducer TonB n=1 Tax=Pseudoalteromonas aliena TaxID=247523 RepID=UPI002494F38E|nr:energy transducer TonB [Pseudoalteromonas aliena]
MKFTIFIILSGLFHFIGLFIQPETHAPITFLQGQRADKVSINLINSQAVISKSLLVKVNEQPQAVIEPTASTMFSGQKRHVSKTTKPDSKIVSKSVTNKRPRKIKPQLKKTINQQTVAKKKPVQRKPSKTAATANVKADSLKTPAPMASAAELSKQNSATSELVNIAKLPLFKAPKPTLSYPLRAKKRGYEGVAMLQIELNKNGEIAKLTLLKSSGFVELDQAALNNVAQWQFYPVLKNSHPVKALFSVPIKFSLNV